MTRDELSDLTGVGLDPRCYEDLQTFVALVEKWTPRINLIARSTVAEIWRRHIADAVQIFPLVPTQARLWADFGSGGGFPGLVLAILTRQFAPGSQHVLVESDQRKATFLREVIRQTGVSASVRDQRIETVPPLRADVVTARALAPLDSLLALIAPHMASDGCAVLPKGAAADSEVAAARVGWSFDLVASPSLIEPEARILRISALRRMSEGRSGI